MVTALVVSIGCGRAHAALATPVALRVDRLGHQRLDVLCVIHTEDLLLNLEHLSGVLGAVIVIVEPLVPHRVHLLDEDCVRVLFTERAAEA